MPRKTRATTTLMTQPVASADMSNIVSPPNRLFLASRRSLTSVGSVLFGAFAAASDNRVQIGEPPARFAGYRDRPHKFKSLCILWGRAAPDVDHSFANAEHYHREAAMLREPAEEVQDERLRQQLIDIAESYDGVAGSIDQTARIDQTSVPRSVTLSSTAGGPGFGAGGSVGGSRLLKTHPSRVLP